MTDTSSEREKSTNVGVLKAMMTFLRPYRWQMIGSSIALICTAGITLSIGQGLRMLVDQGFSNNASVEALNQALLLFMVMILLLAAGTFARFYLVSWIGERVSADLRKAVFAHVVHLHPGYFETNLSGEIQSRITTDTTLLQTVIGSSVSIALRNFLMFVGGLILLFITNPKLTGLVMLSVPLVVVPIIVFGRRVRSLSRTSQDRIAGVGSFVGEAVKNIKMVQAFNHQKLDKASFDGHVESAFDIAVGRINQRAWLSTIVITLVLGAVTAMLWVGGMDVLAGKISGGELTAFIFYAVMVAASVGAISEVYGDLQRAAGATERLLELLAADNLVPTPEAPLPLPASPQGSLQFDNVCFSYPSRPEQLAIDKLNLQIASGSSVALVGSSGAGKSTLVDLILRFYDVQAGVIRFDGIDIRDLSLETLRSQIALVPQQPVLFTGTVADNIRYGKPSASMAEIEAAARSAYAHEFIERLSDGYGSFVGEGGIRLSGGQRQRIAIARAILADPTLLLLDEATSALDAESEFQVQQALELLMHGRTTIVIAHRLATVVDVDVIVVLEHGKLVATGSHAELLKSSPLYARWASLQFDEGANTLDIPATA
ncbi:Multidrug resistance ABC transporter ATP-binding/permease protein BmrA [Zhongshania aliphaticivorans]|uniref:Multidrug resistance ABC transporter ATP-binding/permease protein BmrA n=2 Tax=Zhongshania aliphaticivorans TaxID=1470434 RepID=A0A5S9QJ64_9GAMM|nr:ABC transporter transmembrane domain-containing protein [Zhongshania aliphaticivorans]CAA0109515.1 Multidrug resistance ABC transporter ATP-binding/permease protein BmrA [Zhongshania aliphaticivorans]CAA0117708.1 Multidrug resistance ABC transporter ATP-binding/permease protein BmrA [Zhongshania aliphaticivorans]